MKFLLLFLLLFFYADASSAVDFIAKAKALNISKKPYWSKLLHYENNHSIINEDKFFLSKNGKTNLEDELIQTIKYFVEDTNSTCRYPARYKWLNSQLNMNLNRSTCRELKKFLEPGFKKISIVFTSERYNSPASVFGHTFLKVDSKYIPYAINYAATIPEGTDPISYFVKGGAGGFSSHYELLTYNMKDFEYTQEEFRDLINYEIKYTQDEVQNIMLHMYEIKDTNEDYYFMSRNCSSELLKLVDMGRYDSEIYKELDSVTIPIDVVYILQNNNLLNKTSITYSKLKLFNEHLKDLSNDEKIMLIKIINRKISTTEIDKSSFTKDRKNKIVIAAISYIEMSLMSNKIGHKYTSTLINLIQLEIKYNIDEKEQADIPLSKNPVSNKYHRVKLGTRSMDNQKTELNLGYRYLYSNRFDMLSKEEKHGSVEFLDVNLRYVDDEVSIDKLTILNMESMPISSEFFTEHTSDFIFGSKRMFYNKSLYSYGEYALGYRFRLNKYFTYRGAIRAGAYYHNEDIYMASAEAAVEFRHSSKFISELKYEANSYTDSQEAYNIYLNNYYKFNKQSSIDFLLMHKNDTKNYDEMRINYNIYF